MTETSIPYTVAPLVRATIGADVTGARVMLPSVVLVMFMSIVTGAIVMLITGAVVTGAVVTGADVTGGVVTGAIVIFISIITGAVVPGGIVVFISMTGAIVTGAVLVVSISVTGADVTGAIVMPTSDVILPPAQHIVEANMSCFMAQSSGKIGILPGISKSAQIASNAMGPTSVLTVKSIIKSGLGSGKPQISQVAGGALQQLSAYLAWVSLH